MVLLRKAPVWIIVDKRKALLKRVYVSSERLHISEPHISGLSFCTERIEITFGMKTRHDFQFMAESLTEPSWTMRREGYPLYGRRKWTLAGRRDRHSIATGLKRPAKRSNGLQGGLSSSYPCPW